MRKFDYRAPRYAVELPVRLTINDAIYIGRCKEISSDGMKLQLDQPLEMGCSGVVRLSERGITLDIPVKICYSDSDQIGLKFLYGSDEQRGEIIRFVSVCVRSRFRSAHLVAW